MAEKSNDAALKMTATLIDGVVVVERTKRGDERGMFERLFDGELLEECGWSGAIAQVNHSYTRDVGVVRGMHFQRAPYREYKLVTCLAGAVWDVAVDLRRASPTFLKHFAIELSAENGKALLVPPGCAHGFQTLSTEVHMVYCHNMPYVKECDDGVNACDTRIGIPWPLEISQRSQRDLGLSFVDDFFEGM